MTTDHDHLGLANRTDPYLPALMAARNDLLSRSWRHVVAVSGALYETGDVEPSPLTCYCEQGKSDARFKLRLWDRSYWIYQADGRVLEARTEQEPDVAVQIILLHYLTCADGARPAGEWIPFRQLPGGQPYDRAFQWRANQRLAQAFTAHPENVIESARVLGGTPMDYGDVSFSFDTLPHLAMAVVLNRSDDGSPVSANVLYDATASHCLPAEDLAVVGELLVERLMGK